jgi:uncharacterized membrane protein HdeD (DUF308 family)
MNTTADPVMPDAFPAVTTDVIKHRKGFLALGIVMLLLGIAAIAFPFFATLAVALLVGWILAISGAVGIVHAFGIKQWKGFLFALLGALLSLGIGMILLFYPLTGVLSLTLLIAAFFLASGVLRVLLALRLRPADHWGWLLTSGALAFLLGALILSQWPQASGWVIGVLVGIDLVFSGWVSIMLAMAARRRPGAI